MADRDASVRTAARRSVVWLVALSLLPVGQSTAQIQRVHRDQWQNVDGIVAAMDLTEGDTVADVGAGEGFLTLRLAERVGPGGRVFAVDIDETALGELRRATGRASLGNVEIVRSEVDDPMLPPQSVKAVLMVITYHELTEHAAMLAGIKRALRPGGRLVILDTPARDSSDSRRQQMTRHHMDMALVEQDLELAGFAVIRRDPTFIDVNDGRHHHRQWMLVAVPGGEQRDEGTTDLAEGEAVVTYLGHAGWAVKTASRLLVFDYVEREPIRAGRSPEHGYGSAAEIADERVAVFVSHAHGDHWDPTVLGWADSIPDVTFVFGWAATGDPSHVQLTEPRALYTHEGLEVRTINHDFDGIPEVGFLVAVDGLVIYHSGDHGSVGDEPNPVFRANIDHLAEIAGPIDLAFLSAFGRRGGGALNGGDRYTIAQVRPNVTFPMHQGGNEGFYAEFAAEVRRLRLPTGVQAVERRGDRFLYSKGRIERLK